MPSRTTSQSLNALPSGTVLHDYVIESELGSGGFSMVYLARHCLNTDWLFAIKEYLPRDLAVRDNNGASVHPVNTEAEDAFEDGRRRFRDEAEQLRRFRNERHVVSCLNYFEANGTAYLVMDYDDGLPLSEFLRQREEAGQPFTEADLRAVVEPLLEGLEIVHRAGVLHRDIKPGNVFVRRPDDIAGRPAQPVLIDFGAAKQNYLERHSRSRAPYTPGYAAYEQISSEGDIGPWTDIYAIGALMWRMVAGGCPDDPRLLITDEAGGERAWSPTPRAAEKRAYALHRGRPDPMPPVTGLGAGRFSSHLLESIDKCLALYPEDRVQDCGELRTLLGVSETSEDNTSNEQYNRRDEAAYDPQDGQWHREPARPDSGSGKTSQSEKSSFGFGLIPATVVALGALLMAIVLVDMGAFEVFDPVRFGGGTEPISAPTTPFRILVEPNNAVVEFVNRPEQYVQGMELPAGTYQIRVSAPGHETRAQFLVHSARSQEHRITLNPIQQAFTVETDPRDARVRILNIVPIYESGMLLPAGSYRIEVSAPGYETIIDTVQHDIVLPTVYRVELPLLLAGIPDDGVGNGTLGPGDFELPSGAYGDLWTVQAQSGQTLTAELTSADFDAWLMLMRPTDAELVAEDDDSGDGTNARITFDVADGGQYLLVASSYDAGDTGDYEIRVDVFHASTRASATKATRGSHIASHDIYSRVARG